MRFRVHSQIAIRRKRSSSGALAQCGLCKVMNELVSIVIPCFNGAATLRETVESALGQSHACKEIIVIDDGSTDGSAEVIRAFDDAVRAEFWPNRGASAARSRGTEIARGAFIQYLDADDLLAPDALERRVAALAATGGDVAYADWQRLVQQGDGAFVPGERVVRTMEPVDGDRQVACAATFWAPPAALLYRRRIVDAIGGWHPGLPVIQDARFLFDAARAGARFMHVPGIGAYYRVQGNDSLSRRDNRAFVMDVYRNACEIQALWEQDGALSAARRQALAGIFDYVSRSLFQWGAPEVDDAFARRRALRRPGEWRYPEVAFALSRLVGAPAARQMMKLLVGAHVRMQRIGLR